MMRSRRSSSRMISARPFLRYVSCSSGVEATKPIVAIDLTPLRLVAVDEIARAKVPFRAKFGEYEGVPCHQVQLRPANSQRLRDEHVFGGVALNQFAQTHRRHRHFGRKAVYVAE